MGASPFIHVGLAVQGSAKRRSPGLVNFIFALAYLFCQALCASFTQPGDHLLAEPCRRGKSAACRSETSTSVIYGADVRGGFHVKDIPGMSTPLTLFLYVLLLLRPPPQ